MANLPTEAMEEILVKLPVKDLLRFKCVCKDWLNLITSRRFIIRHYSDKSKQPCQLSHLYTVRLNEEGLRQMVQYFYSFDRMYDDNRRFLRFEEVNFHPHLPFCNSLISDLTGPVNGVFCVRFISHDLALSNPAMRELRLLPEITAEDDWVDLCNYVVGLGCDLLTGNLKVVALVQHNNSWEDESPPTYLYNSITDSWKTVENRITYQWILSHEHHTFVNGVCYWFVQYNSITPNILAFDVRSENFYLIDIPDYVGLSVSRISYSRIVEHGDSVALHLRKVDGCRHGLPGTICVGEMWPQLDGRSMALDLCTPSVRRDFFSELWVMGKEGFWGRIWRAEADWILPSRWRWVDTNKDDVVLLAVESYNTYKESLFSIKRVEEGEDDSIRDFLEWTRVVDSGFHSQKMATQFFNR